MNNIEEAQKKLAETLLKLEVEQLTSSSLAASLDELDANIEKLTNITEKTNVSINKSN